MLRSDLVRAQFGEMLKSLVLPDNWREEIRKQMIAEAQSQGIMLDSMEREKERLKLKRTRILKQHREGYIDDDEFHAEIAAVELALHHLQTPEVNGVKFDDVIAAGEHIPGMAALWDEATPEERREMVMLLLEPGGLYYDLELKIIAALKPRPAFLPILRMLTGVVEYDEVKGIIVTENWQDRNRRASNSLSPVLIHFLAPHGRLSQRLLALEQVLGSIPPLVSAQQRPGPREPHHGIPPEEWPNVVRRVLEDHEPLRQVATAYGVSRETIRRLLGTAGKKSAG